MLFSVVVSGIQGLVDYGDSCQWDVPNHLTSLYSLTHIPFLPTHFNFYFNYLSLPTGSASFSNFTTNPFFFFLILNFSNCHLPLISFSSSLTLYLFSHLYFIHFSFSSSLIFYFNHQLVIFSSLHPYYFISSSQSPFTHF